MNLDEFSKKHKVNKFYRYFQNKEDNTIEYGWVLSDDIELDGSVVISYHSKSKKASPEEVSWSKLEKTSATSLNDYKKYFKSFTGVSPEEFLKKWGDSQKEFSLHWKENSPYWQEGQDQFVLNLAKLIVEHKRFSMYSRGFKVVSPSSN